MRCKRVIAVALPYVLTVLAWNATFVDAQPEPSTAIPALNAPNLREAPPLPALGDATERARVLLDAIVADDPARAHGLFLPRDAFRLIKATGNPDALYDRLLAAYDRDIHALHKELAGSEAPTFVRLELSRRREWVLPLVEANRLPYWAQRHNTLVIARGKREQHIEVRVMIAWDGRWYITHLSEFRHTGKAPH